MLKSNRIIFFLDDKCIMCNRFCQFLDHRLNSIEFHPIFSPAAKRVFNTYGIEIKTEVNTSYLWNGERFLSKSESFFFLMRKMDYPFKIIGWFAFLRYLGSDRVYDLIQRNRHKFFIRNSCSITPVQIVPDKDILEIFDYENI